MMVICIYMPLGKIVTGLDFGPNAKIYVLFTVTKIPGFKVQRLSTC